MEHTCPDCDVWSVAMEIHPIVSPTQLVSAVLLVTGLTSTESGGVGGACNGLSLALPFSRSSSRNARLYRETREKVPSQTLFSQARETHNKSGGIQGHG